MWKPGPVFLFVVLALAPVGAAAQQATTAQLAQQVADSAGRALALALTRYTSGVGTADEVGMWAARWYAARRDTGLSGPALQGAAQDWVDKMRTFEQTVRARTQSGLASPLDAEIATFYRLQAELALARLKTP